jgi:predicted GTPase
MGTAWAPTTILWAVGGWLAMTVAALAIAAAVVTSLPQDFFRNPAPAGRVTGWALLRRVGRNAVGLVLIALGLVLSIPGVPGQGILTVLAGVLLVDFPGRHRVATALARLPGVLETMNRMRRRLHRPPLLPPGPPSEPRRRTERVVILGAAGRDFHDFNVVYRNDPTVVVVAFTAAQIPGIAHRRYPPSLAGARYPQGIPIEDEAALEEICRRERVDRVVFAYSDVSHAHVMALACRALAAGADFALLGPERTMLRASVPVVAVSAVRTGCGKSPIARWLGRRLREAGRRVAVVRHPMPYGQLERQRVQRFATLDDLTAADCTIEEREEYEPHVAAGTVVFAGADYAEVIARAAAEADVIVWDGGNNDFPFVRPDLHVVVADALRPDHARGYYPGEAVIRTADVVVVNKVNAAPPADVARAIEGARQLNPRAPVVRGALGVRLDAPERVRGRRAIVVEDGPTITHGSMPHGAGLVAAISAGAAAIVDPRSAAVPEVAAVYAQYPHIGPVLPAVGYSAGQVAALQATLEGADADVVVAATPVDLQRLVTVSKPIVRARYDFEDADEPGLAALVDRWTARTWGAR